MFIIVLITISFVVFVYMIPDWGQTDFNGARLGATTRETAEIWSVGPDYGSYFHAALSWYQDGVLADLDYQWVTNLWPPGMVLLNATVISVVGMDGRFVFTLAGVTAMIWSLVFTCGLFVCKSGIQRVVFVAGILVSFLTTPFSKWIASDYFALPTGFALALALLALMTMTALEPPSSVSRVWPSPHEVIRLVAIAGPLLAISLLFRVASLWAIYGVIATAGLVGIWVVVDRIRYRRQADLSSDIRDRRLRNGRFVVRLLLISIVPILVMLSWTWVVSAKAHPERFSYTITVPELAYGALWKTDAELIESGNPWLLDSSSNWACRVDEETCAKIAAAEADSSRPYAGVDEYSTNDYMRLAIIGAIKDPLDYLRERAPKAWYNWSSGNAAQGFLFLLTTAAALVLAASRILRERDLQAFVFVCMVVTATAPMLTILFYFYYFIPIQIGSVFYLLINQDAARALVLDWRRSGGDSANSEDGVPQGHDSNLTAFSEVQLGSGSVEMVTEEEVADRLC
jgi:hypothetical protein